MFMKLKSGGECEYRAEAPPRQSRAPLPLNMDALLLVILQLSLAGFGCGEPLSVALKHRSDFNVYASDFAAEYEPMSFAAVPLHAPVRLLQILSPAPLQDIPPLATLRDRQHNVGVRGWHGSLGQGSPVYAPSIAHGMYAKPPPYYASYYRYDDDAPTPELPRPPPPTIIYTHPLSTDESSPNILYASPNKNGGYTYHTKPARKRKPAQKRPPPRSKQPLIIRVHKYRVIDD